jgi:hypothetical protein
MTSSLSLFLCLANYPSTDPAGVSPTHVFGNNVFVVDTGDSNVKWARAMGVGISNCSGTVFALHNTTCSILTDTRIENSITLKYWITHNLRFFVEGSYLSLTYAGGNHVLAVVKSYAAHQAYLDLCENLTDMAKGRVCNNVKTLPHLCAGNDTNINPVLLENTWCFENKLSVTFVINETDFYSVMVSYEDEVPIVRGVNYIYNYSILYDYEERSEYNITSSQERGYAWLPITRSFLSFDSWDTCVLFQSDCATANTGSEMDYVFQRRQDTFNFFSSLYLIVCVCIAFSMLVCHVCCVRRRNHQNEGES